uniref:Uncharacterized protein n=1 Tax=Salmo trutta TaxID=8032 RepID=A0A673VYA0_SALTR
MALVKRTLQVANQARCKFLDWRKKRLQDKLSETQKKLK